MRTITNMTLCCIFVAPIACAHEYALHFTPNPGYRGLVVAGYRFSGDTVIGNCSYYTVHSGSGRGGGYRTTKTYYNQTCTWDLYGNLLSMTPGAPTAPAPIYTSGTQTVYARNASGESTGTDTALPFGGFVNTPGSHYTWLTSNAYLALPQAVWTLTTTLKSDGDIPVTISAVQASARLAKVTVQSTTCKGEVPVGATCSVTVTYDPTKLSSPTGLAYDTLTIAITSDAGQASDFVQSYTVTVSVSDDN